MASMKKRVFIFLLAALLPALVCRAQDKERRRALSVVKLMFGYAATVDTAEMEHKERFAYLKYSLRTNRRNAVLLAVPTMFAIANGGSREYVGETYDRVEANRFGEMHATRLLERTTIPHKSSAMPTLLKYLTPTVYSEQLIDRHILSPFFARNRRYYRYRVSPHSLGEALVKFRPRLKNTQLVTGWARVERATGRVVEAAVDGEYDMVRFHLELKMGASGVESLLPKRCDLNARFVFMGNDINAEYTSVYGLPARLLDTIPARSDTTLLNLVRPIPLTQHERLLFGKLYARRDSAQTDSTAAAPRRQKLAKGLWDNVGKNLLDRIRTSFGTHGQGYFRINPILNPLYFSYSRRRGFTYKFDMRGNYYFTDNSLLEWRFKSGYAFKQRQFYFTLPITWYFNHRRDGYVKMEWKNGRRLTTSAVADALRQEHGDSIDWGAMNLEYFRNYSLKVVAAYNVLPRLGIQVGFLGHRRTAVDKTGFIAARTPSSYVSAAPIIGLEYRPWGRRGAVFTADYERSIRGFMKANIEYERCEIDGQYTHWLSALSALQMRLGTGFYTHKGSGWVFLDYTNFHERNIPGGWNDDWACDFELLNSNWYNASEYYVRANLTYESPLLMLSWLPLAGRLIEKERVYVNILNVRKLHPYVEYGYGFTCRAFSLAAFVSQKNGKFDGFSVRMGLELFRHW